MPEIMAQAAPDLSLLAINLTRRCNLECAHCYLDAGILRRGDSDELSTAEVKSLLDDVAALDHGTLIVLTGGEPLLRRDLETIVRHGVARGLPVVIGTNAMMLSERRLRSLDDAGVLGFGISLDSLEPARHDRFRGRSGAWARTMAGIDRCRRHGIDFQLHFSVTGDAARAHSTFSFWSALAGQTRWQPWIAKNTSGFWPSWCRPRPTIRTSSYGRAAHRITSVSHTSSGHRRW